MATFLKGRAAPTAQQGPVSGSAALIVGRIRERRQELADHNPEAVQLAGVVIAALHEAAYRHVPEIRCDQQVRHRLKQLMGERALPLEDLVAIGEENEAGRAVAVAGLRMLLGAWGYTLTAVEPGARIGQTAAEVFEGAGRLGAGMTIALEGDGRVDAAEAERLAPIAEELHRDSGRLLGDLAATRAGRNR